jgi:hypothetical protein
MLLDNYDDTIADADNEANYEVVCDRITKFFKSFYIEGWFYHPSDDLADVDLENAGVVDSMGTVQLNDDAVGSVPKDNIRFEYQCLRENQTVDEDTKVRFTTEAGVELTAPLLQLSIDRYERYDFPDLLPSFVDRVNESATRVLDVGGRDRSGVGHDHGIEVDEYVTFDIVSDEGVDVVGDAHYLSDYFPDEYFDAIISTSTFEHILMPWKVAVEMNSVLKNSGLVYVESHQTLGLHDAPWDFWRFSDTAWDALFNHYTGFEIIDRCMDKEQFVLPFVYRPPKHDAEDAAGFDGSAMIARKTGDSSVSWGVPPDELTRAEYPTDEDNLTESTEQWVNRMKDNS